MLHLIVFLSGAVLMSLEMIGSRLLAPFFGNSIYVWGSLITVVMAALTLGYYLGGKTADRRPSLSPLGGIFLLAGLLVGFLPLWSARLGWRLSQYEPRLGSLLAALAYFFLPSLLLAMISPFGVKLAGRSLGNIGGTAGRLSAVSSAGSILGTLVTSFYLVPVMGVRAIAHSLGLILFGLAVLAGMAALRAGRAKGRRRFPLGLIILACAASLALVLCWRSTKPENPAHPGSSSVSTLYARDTLYHHLVVDQSGGERHLHFDNSWQSALDLTDPDRMVFDYTSAMHLAAVARPSPRRALLIGLGGGSMPRRFLRDYPSLERMDVVEIDPEVAAVARKYFLLPDDPRLRVIIEDGRIFVERRARLIAQGLDEPYDLVMIDA
ncbi:MAG: spermidine synthase, partial [Bacteroidota bacterium]